MYRILCSILLFSIRFDRIELYCIVSGVWNCSCFFYSSSSSLVVFYLNEIETSTHIHTQELTHLIHILFCVDEMNRKATFHSACIWQNGIYGATALYSATFRKSIVVLIHNGTICIHIFIYFWCGFLKFEM